MYIMMTVANTAMIHKEIVKRVNPEFLSQGEIFFCLFFYCIYITRWMLAEPNMVIIS